MGTLYSLTVNCVSEADADRVIRVHGHAGSFLRALALAMASPFPRRHYTLVRTRNDVFRELDDG